MLSRNDEQNRKVISEIAKQPKTTHNTTHNNLVLPSVDMTQTSINEAVELHYDRNHLFAGQKGVADFAKEHILTNEQKELGYICTDSARGVFKHIGEDGEIVKDIKAIEINNKAS